MSPRTSRRDEILDAAADLVRESGAAHLTLDAVCVKAKVSKGGFLYHFQTKESLLLAMFARLIEMLESAQARELKKLPPTPARSLKSHVLSMEVLWSKKAQPIAAALLAVGTNDPGLLKQAQESHRAMIREMELSGLSPAFIRVIVFASLGLHLSEMLGISTHTSEERQDFYRELLHLVTEKEDQL